jgi:hypothetical protein
MPSEAQLQRFVQDWGRVKEVAGKKIDSVQFAAPEPGKERLVLRCQDGTRLVVESQQDGSIRAWLSCCGKPDGCAPGLNG